MPHLEGHGPWPESTVVTEHFHVTFEPAVPTEEFPVVQYSLCFNSHRNGGANDPSCRPIEGIEAQGDGQVRGTVTTLREAGTDSPGWIRATFGKEQPGLFASRSLSPEEVLELSERVVVQSNEVPLPTAAAHVAPEPALGVGLLAGVIFLTVSLKLKRRLTVT